MKKVLVVLALVLLAFTYLDWERDCYDVLEITPIANGNHVRCYREDITSTSTPISTVTPTIAVPTPTRVNSFLETFDNQAATPIPWNPGNWDVVVHSRDRETWLQLNPMEAAHGVNCDPPPDKHTITNYEDVVFLCRDHLMTALRADGYGVVYLTPNQLVDFSTGEAIIRLDVSTLRTTNRDWWDIWIMKPQDNLALPLEQWLPDLQGEPKNAIHIRLNFGSGSNPSGVFIGEVVTNFNAVQLSRARTLGYETLFIPSALQRRTFELRISKTHIRFGLPDFNFWWIDTDIPPLTWETGMVSIGAHSYNPFKDCVSCLPSTYHWDNISINPTIPFTLLRGDRRYVNSETTSLVQFDTPSTIPGFLRFSGIGSNIQVSFNNENIWRLAALQVQEENDSGHFKTYWMPIPIGTEQVRFKGERWYGGGWFVKDISIISIPEN